MPKAAQRRGNPKIAEVGIATRFKPGDSGNPKGRPKTRHVSETYRYLSDLTVRELQDIVKDPDSTALMAMCSQMYLKAIRGFVNASLGIGDRMEGKPTQPIQLDHGINDATAQTIAQLAQEPFWKGALPSQFASPDIRVPEIKEPAMIVERIVTNIAPEQRTEYAAPPARDTAYDEQRTRQVLDPFPRI